MQEVISREAAEEMISLWADALDTEAPAGAEKLIKAIMSGRVDFDENTETFTIKLKKPLQLENGEPVHAVKMREPTSGELQKAMKGTKDDELAMMVKLISITSGQPLGIVDRIKQRDLMTIGEVYRFFE